MESNSLAEDKVSVSVWRLMRDDSNEGLRYGKVWDEDGQVEIMN